MLFEIVPFLGADILSIVALSPDFKRRDKPGTLRDALGTQRSYREIFGILQLPTLS